jgi:hypothetical protein
MPTQFQDVVQDDRLTKTSWLRGALSTSAEVLLIPLQTPDGQPLPLDHNNSKKIPDLGTIDWGAHADAFTVGGQMIVRCSLYEPHALTSVWSIRFQINQIVTVQTSDTRSSSKDPVPIIDRFLLYCKGPLPRPEEIRSRDGKGIMGRGMAEPLWEGEAVPGPDKFKHLSRLDVDEYIRLPCENSLRPTTCPG